MTKTKRRIRFYLLYTVIFMVTAWLVLRYFFTGGKTLIRGYDGWRQHYKALIFYSRWLRMIVLNFLKHGKLSVPAFSFGIGFGADAMTTLHYYAIGDPLNLLSVFVPGRYMSYFYEFLIILRVYLAGIAFSCYCFSKKRFSDNAVIAGAITYCFCTYAMWGGIRHPYFMNPMIYFPLLLLGVDRIAQKKSPWLFIAMVAVSGASNFYFFYMLVFLTVLYVIGNYILKRKRTWKESLLLVLKLGVLGLVGILLAAAILLPVIGLFLNSSRQDNGYVYAPLYLADYYEKLLSAFLTYRGLGYYTRMGFAIPALTSVFLLFAAGREKRRLQAAFAAATLMLMIPAAGYILNGMSYVSNRWIWGYSMLVAYIVADRWEAHIRMPEKVLLRLTLLTLLYNLLYFLFDGSAENKMKFVLVLELILLLVLWLFREGGRWKEKKAQAAILLAITVFSSAGNAYFGIAPSQDNYVGEFENQKTVTAWPKDVQGNAVKEAIRLSTGENPNSNDFYRYSSNNLDINETLLNGTSNTQFYWSLSDHRRYEFWKEMGLSETNTSDYQGLDARAALNALCGVGYFVAEDASGIKKYVPYGFERIKDSGEEEVSDTAEGTKEYRVYENENALPLGYTYTEVITREKYDKLSSVEKQEAMLQGVLLDKVPEGFEEAGISLTSKVQEPKIICKSQNVTVQGNSFVVTKKGAAVTLEFDGEKDCELYLNIEGLDYKGVTKYRLYNDDKAIDPLDLYTAEEWEKLPEARKEKLEEIDHSWRDDKKVELLVSSRGVKREVFYGPDQYQWRNNRHDFCTNLGYSEKVRKKITVKFMALGTYSFDSLKVISQPMDKFDGQVKALREDTLENLNMNRDSKTHVTDLITGDISLDVPKILCLSIPYSDGWTAYVDGKKQELLQANTMFMALSLESGEHSIRLEYHTPGKKVGIALGVLGWLCVLGIAIVRRRKDRDQCH